MILLILFLSCTIITDEETVKNEDQRKKINS